MPAAHGHDGEVESVEVVAEVEDAWEAGAGEPFFVPATVGALSFVEPVDGADDIGVFGTVDGHECHGAP